MYLTTPPAMQPRMIMQFDRELIAASTSVLILSILNRKAAGGSPLRSYGYAIIKEVAALSLDRLSWTDGMLYPVLHRLEHNGFVQSQWQRSESGRRRKYYRITSVGTEELARLKIQWSSVDSIVRSSWAASEGQEYHASEEKE